MKNITSFALLTIAFLGFTVASAVASPTAPAPETGSTALMLGLGLAGFAILARRLRK